MVHKSLCPLLAQFAARRSGERRDGAGAKRQRVLDARGVGIFVTSTLIFALSPVSSFAQMPFYACTQSAGGNEASRVSGGGCRGEGVGNEAEKQHQFA